ncbi:hypothetical protein pEaSNUABM50_00536 [Erwinia phage pEa_SNUABM_50]|uniref:Uncharacterized protein n=3 Tax=Eneladusvirus BF TaxID=2560751 RepID=A0A7L8ZNC7_9CAUD|nr:hypothetical protein pEaSNUABM12_00520 [Erwinia phage pEa_SNUABM_12]QOI71986.1 hypothetical protein pEaSNUABM47_00537 [Erwinia phage pEa_SNUABM_47]QOI72526.1 hypothetical protein pEaSNUABM50_00536 [Erwinia phage pEa_SNUABM_50]QXO11658.1 hypothetical protein pEaSNUABM19_00547 [Erwinia phage pEa_SNUABM_19]QXO12207.1 hypothetical protein pEaSNUABM44_00546 [Erwinia phage pEa_SNUABM_44]QXO12763.1 hypothetical protein pEaSNUABM49_00550 [Erwinia phage pEa_SNUABM_49]
MEKEKERIGLVVSISVVLKLNPIQTQVQSFMFEDIEKGREFAKKHTTLSTQLIAII